jgi:hypothetical protein
MLPHAPYRQKTSDITAAVLHGEWEDAEKQVLLPREVNVWLVLHDGARFRCMKISPRSTFVYGYTVPIPSEP